MLNKEYVAVCKEMGWGVDDRSTPGYVELSQTSPAGEDFRFMVTENDFFNQVRDYSCDFDVNEHVMMWASAKQAGTQGVPDIRTLVHDTEKIESMLDELVMQLWLVEEE